MSKFIELTRLISGPVLINIDNITKVYPGKVYTTNSNFPIETKESYDEIVDLIERNIARDGAKPI